MEIRLLTAPDAAAFWNLRLQALEQEPHAFGSSPEEHRTMSIEATTQRLAAKPGGSFIVGAFDAAALIGNAGFYREDRLKTRHKGAIWGVYVAPEWRGRGVARALLLAVIERVRGYGDLDHVVLHVSTDQLPARRLYTALGFEIFGHEPRAFKIGGEYIDQDEMLLALR